MNTQNTTPESFPKGTTVRVVKGRKLPHGTTGDVFWAGWDKYKAGQVRIGFKTDESDEALWASDWMVEVVLTVEQNAALQADVENLSAMSDEDMDLMEMESPF